MLPTNQNKKGNALPDKNLIIIFVITLFAVMGVISIAPAFPQIREHFDITKQQVGYLVTVFTLPGIILAPLAGILADRYGRKAILIPSLLLFGLAGGACSLAPDYPTLLIIRLIQGIGAASLGAINVTLIGDLYTGNKRAQAMGYNASVLSIGTASYPFIGGALALISWKIVFFLPLLTLPLAIWLAVSFHPPFKGSPQHIPSYLRKLVEILINIKVLGLLILNLLVFFLIYGAFVTYLPPLLNERFAASSFQIGITMSIMSVTTAIVSSQAGNLSIRFSARKVLLAGTLSYLVAMIGFAYADNWLLLAVPVLIFGVGQGLFMPAVQTLLVGYASVKERAALMSLNSMMLRSGQTLAPLIIGVAFGLSGYRGAYLGAAMISVIMIFIVLITVRAPGKPSE